MTSWIGVARLVRAEVLALKEKEYIEAARAIGTPTWRIMAGHLLPNLLGSLVVYGTFAVPGFIAVEAMLEYLGIGVKPPYPAWGAMIAEGQQNIWSAPHLLWAPAVCIGLVTLAFTFLGDRLRDALDPTMQTRGKSSKI
jgi:oligopeptide transport system permease protein